MKKIYHLSLILLALGLAVGCAPKNASPGAAAKQYMEALADGQIDQFVDGFYLGEEVTGEDIEEYKNGMKSMLTEKAIPALDEKGGLKSVEIVSEEIADDGLSATVVLRQTYGDGESEEDSTEMILVDGRWMMKMEK